MITRLKIIRMKKGIPQWELAHRANISATVLSLIETGRIIPSAEVKRAISKTFRKPIKVLFPERKRK
jgi:DNA-binding XRE family transcriptional regulator